MPDLNLSQEIKQILPNKLSPYYDLPNVINPIPYQNHTIVGHESEASSNAEITEIMAAAEWKCVFTGIPSVANEATQWLSASSVGRRSKEWREEMKGRRGRAEHTVKRLGIVTGNFDVDGEENVAPVSPSWRRLMDDYGVLALCPSPKSLRALLRSLEAANEEYLKRINIAGSKKQRRVIDCPTDISYDIIVFHPQQLAPQNIPILLSDPRQSSEAVKVTLFELRNGKFYYLDSPTKPRPSLPLPSGVPLSPFIITIHCDHLASLNESHYPGYDTTLSQETRHQLRLAREVAKAAMTLPTPTSKKGMEIDKRYEEKEEEDRKRREREEDLENEREKKRKKKKGEKEGEGGVEEGEGKGEGAEKGEEDASAADVSADGSEDPPEEVSIEEASQDIEDERIRGVRQDFALDKLERNLTSGEMSGDELRQAWGEFMTPNFRPIAPVDV